MVVLPSGILGNLSDVHLRFQFLQSPDASLGIRCRAIQNPRPSWMRFQSIRQPYPNVMIKVVVNHEGPKSS